MKVLIPKTTEHSKSKECTSKARGCSDRSQYSRSRTAALTTSAVVATQMEAHKSLLPLITQVNNLVGNGVPGGH